MYCKKLLDEKSCIKPTQTDPYSTLQNDAKYGIFLVKVPTLNQMLEYGLPARLWDNEIKYHAYIISDIVLPDYDCIKGRVPHELMGGMAPAIYQQCTFTTTGLSGIWIQNMQEYYPRQDRNLEFLRAQTTKLSKQCVSISHLNISGVHLKYYRHWRGKQYNMCCLRNQRCQNYRRC